MRMRGLADFGGGGFERLAEHDFRNYITRVVADDLASDPLAVLLGCDDLHEAFRLADRDCPAESPKWELADLDLEPARLCIGLAQTHGRDLRLAVDASGNVE